MDSVVTEWPPICYRRKMKFHLVKNKDVQTISRGPKSDLSDLRPILFAMKTTEESVLIQADSTEEQRRIYGRMRSNVNHWKVRHGLKNISVRLTKDGNVALEFVGPKTRKRGRVVYGGGLENR